MSNDNFRLERKTETIASEKEKITQNHKGVIVRSVGIKKLKKNDAKRKTERTQKYVRKKYINKQFFLTEGRVKIIYCR